MATNESLPCQDQHSSSSSREGAEPKIKQKKLRSIKLLRIPSLKPPKRRPKSRSDRHQIVLSGNVGYQFNELSPSPNYMKATSCSDARKENFQVSASSSESSSSDYDSSRPSSAPAGLKSTSFFESTSSLREMRTFPRNSSFKSKNPQVNKKLKKPRPTRMSDTPQLNSKATNLSEQGLKSGKVLTKTISLRPVRILTKMASLRSKKPSMRKCSEVYQIPDTSVSKATCSSTFKNSKFPKYAEVQPEGTESEGTSSMKVCPYTYCSLHGHHRDAAPPLKRFVSVRRRLLQSQKSMKPKIRPSVKAKNPGDAKKVIRATVRDAAVFIDDAVSTRNEVGSVVVGEVHEGTADLVSMTDDPLDRSTSSTSDDLMESTAATSNLSASVRDRFDDLLHQGLPPLGSSARNRTTALADETRMEKEKFISMWCLLHQSVSSGNVSTMLHPDGRVDNVNALLQENNSGQSNKKIELDAIKLVKEAFDEILLPEVQDQSSDAQSITSDINSNEDLPEKNQDEDGEGSISTSTNSAKDSLGEFDKMKMGNGIVDREEASLEAEQKKTVPKVGSKSDQPMPKNWSKLKKLILFKRFVKALDKVRNLNFMEPQHLPLEPEPGAESVKLRHQTAEERKRAEEWMLDYALRQVVGNLSPTRRKKVELLVEAFETVIPVSGNGSRLRLKAAVPPRTKPSQADVGTLVQGGTEKEQKETSLECCHIESDLENPNAQATDTVGKEDGIDASKLDNGEKNIIFADNQPGSVHSHSPDDYVLSTSPEEVPVAGKVFEEVNEKIISSAKPNSLDVDSGSNSENSKKHDSLDCQDLTATMTAVSSASACELLRVEPAVSKESSRDSEKFNQWFQRSEDTKPESDVHEAYKTQLDKQKYMKMWRVIYHQVASGSAAKFGSHQHLDASTPDGEKNSSSLQGLSDTNVSVKHSTMQQKINFNQIEAIKLVEKAIDEIVLPEIEEQSSEDQPIANDIISDKSFLRKNDGEGGNSSIPISNDSADNNFRKLGQTNDSAEESPLKDGETAPEQERMKLKIGSRSIQQRPSNWSNLKKLILLNRFVKALEKVREFNPREPRYLPLEHDPEADKVNLRHQTTEERKSAEEWMIDNAIQQVVARLTPARKRRVELLVEAFETVTPLSDNGTTPKPSTGQRIWPMRSPQ